VKKNIVITGANRGIGLAMVAHYQAQGNNVYALCRKSSKELSAMEVNIITGVDVATDEGLANMVSALANIYIDVLICNAGILREEQLSALNIDTIREQFEVNAIAPLRVVDSLLGGLTAGSKIAMITSRMGSIKDNTSGGRYGYRMSKAALNAAAMSLARDLKNQNIAVGIYHPGYVQTDMVNHGGDISASEAAQRIIGLIAKLDMQESGVFKHSNGQTLPW